MEKNLKKKLNQKLEEIKNEIAYSTSHNDDLGLMGGKSGEILFLLNYSSYKDDESILNYSLSLVENLINNLDIKSPTFCNGYAGIGWLLEYIKKNGYAEIDTTDLLCDVDVFIYNQIIKDISIGNYDYLHGAIGGGMYFLNRTESDLRNEALSALTNDLIKIRSENSKYIAWDFFNIKTQKIEKGNYNFGLSHGIPSILYFLSKINCDKKLSIKIPNYIINKGIDFLLNNQKNGKEFGSCFSHSNQELETSRLAWCYGDLGICMMLIQIGSEVGRLDVLKIAENILDFNCNRIDLKSSKVYDAGFCHGSSGIAYVFKEAYRFYRKKKYLDISNFWYENTLKQSSFEDGLAGFKSFNSLENRHIRDRSFLEGISGVGLSIIGGFSSRQKYSWDNALLLS